MHVMMMAENRCWIALRVNGERFKITANVVGHLSAAILVTLLHLTRLIETRFIALIIHASENEHIKDEQ